MCLVVISGKISSAKRRDGTHRMPLLRPSLRPTHRNEARTTRSTNAPSGWRPRQRRQIGKGRARQREGPGKTQGQNVPTGFIFCINRKMSGYPVCSFNGHLYSHGYNFFYESPVLPFVSLCS